jgi:YggT family protein
LPTEAALAAKVGGAEGSRTPDLLIANEALSQLSYGPRLRLRPAQMAGPASAGHLGPPFPGVKDGRGGGEGRKEAKSDGLFANPQIANFPPSLERDRSWCRSSILIERGLFGKPVAAFPDHTLTQSRSMRAFFEVIDIALSLYMWIVIAMAIFSWLVAFNVVNTRNQVVAMIGDFLYRITEPALRPIRNFMPNLGGIDISPVILFLIIIFIQRVIELYVLPNVY